MTKLKLVSYLMGASIALTLQPAASFAATLQFSDNAAVKAVTERFATDLAKHDLKAISLLYTADAKLLPPNERAISGRAAILAYFKKNLRPDRVARAKFSHYEIYDGGDAATSISELAMYNSKGHIIERGRQIIVLTKQGGRWKIHRDMWSDNTPAKACN